MGKSGSPSRAGVMGRRAQRGACAYRARPAPDVKCQPSQGVFQAASAELGVRLASIVAPAGARLVDATAAVGLHGRERAGALRLRLGKRTLRGAALLDVHLQRTLSVWVPARTGPERICC